MEESIQYKPLVRPMSSVFNSGIEDYRAEHGWKEGSGEGITAVLIRVAPVQDLNPSI